MHSPTHSLTPAITTHHHRLWKIDPLVSTWCVGAPPREAAPFTAADTSLQAATPAGLKLIHGFSEAALLPSGKVPSLTQVELPDHVHLVVSRVPGAAANAFGVADPEFASLMLHGWLFRNFGASDRKAHQKLPLISIHNGDNVIAAPGAGLDAPQWLPTNGEFGWADQHVHRDEPVDLGGFMFAEVFFGSDMARVGISDRQKPASCWVVAVDAEESRGLVSFVVMLPEATTEVGGEIADGELDALLKQASTPTDVATALRKRYGQAANIAATAVDRLVGGAGAQMPDPE
jgi:hypothetical protein